MDRRKEIEEQAEYARQLYLATYHDDLEKKKKNNKEAKEISAKFHAGEMTQKKKDLGF